jgi:hypothetical protein
MVNEISSFFFKFCLLILITIIRAEISLFGLGLPERFEDSLKYKKNEKKKLKNPPT